ncbi:MAG: radical SAM protein [Thermoproteota archaeon]
MGLNKEVLKKLNEVKKMLEIRVSLDGFEGHDKVRGKNSVLVRKNVELISHITDLPVHINTMITKHNIWELMKLYEWIKAHSEVISGWSSDLPIQRGRYSKTFIELQVNREELYRVLYKLVSRYLQDAPPFQLALFAIFRRGLINPHALKKIGLYTFSKDSHPCSYASSLVIRTDGFIGLCPSLPITFGNIRDHTLFEIIKNYKDYSDNCRKFTEIRIEHLKECSTCRFLKLCGGGCRAKAYLESGDLLGKDRLTCELMEFFESKILKLLPLESKALIERLIEMPNT